MITCHCCGHHQIEEVLVDRLLGAGPRRVYRIRQGSYILVEVHTLDELAAELDRRGILMWPEDGCE